MLPDDLNRLVKWLPFLFDRVQMQLRKLHCGKKRGTREVQMWASWMDLNVNVISLGEMKAEDTVEHLLRTDSIHKLQRRACANLLNA